MRKTRWPHFKVRLKCRMREHPPAYPIEVLPEGRYWASKPRNVWSCECGKELYEHKAYS